MNSPPLKERQKPPLPYRWSLISDTQNKILKDLVTQPKFADRPLILMDVDSVTALRANSHASANDCLHYSRPGPAAYWVEHLINIVRASNLIE